MSDADPLEAGTASAGTSAETSRSDHVHPAGTGEATPLSDELPVNIGPQSQQGDGASASRDDHTHYLPHDNTIGFNTDGELAVSIHDVVEHLSERIQYYTGDTDYSTDGSAAGQVYNSSRYPKNLQWVKAHLRVPAGVSDAIYRAGVYRVASDNEILEVLGQSGTTGIVTGTATHRFDFLAEATSALGIPLEGSERIMVLIRRVGAGNTADTGLIHGSEHDDSPHASYVDAANDFVLANHVVVEHENPTVGQGTHSHGGFIRGNLQLGYTVIIDHGSLIGDPGNVNVGHIGSGAATVGQLITADGAGGADWEDPAPGGGGGSGTGTFVRETLFEDTAGRNGSSSNAIVVTLDRAPVEGSRIETTLSKQYGSVADGFYFTHVHMEEIEANDWLAGTVVLAADTRPDGIDADGSDGDYHLLRASRPQSGTTFSQAASSMYVGRVSDTEFLIRPSAPWPDNFNPFRIRIREILPSGGSAQQQAAGLTRLDDIEIISSRLFPTEYDLSTEWDEVFDEISPTFTPIIPADVDRIEVGFWVGSRYAVTMVITQAMIIEMGGTGGIPAGAVSSTTIKGAYISGRLNPESDSRDPMVINPKYGYLEDRRTAGRYGILVGLPQNVDDEMTQLRVWVSADIEIDVQYAKIIPRGAAV